MSNPNGSTNPVGDTGSKKLPNNGKKQGIQLPENNTPSSRNPTRNNFSPRSFHPLPPHPSSSRPISMRQDSFASRASQNEFLDGNRNSTNRTLGEINSHNPSYKTVNNLGVPPAVAKNNCRADYKLKSRLGAIITDSPESYVPSGVPSEYTIASPSRRSDELQIQNGEQESHYESYGFKEYNPKKFRKFFSYFNLNMFSLLIITLIILGIFIGLPVGLSFRKPKPVI
ncbi:hypothetical protein BB560_004408, partial [Smittium megazygosporum]